MRNGLSNKEVLASRKKHGSNQISGQKRNSFFSLFLETLGDPIIKILLIALAIKTVFLFQDFNMAVRQLLKNFKKNLLKLIVK